MVQEFNEIRINGTKVKILNRTDILEDINKVMKTGMISNHTFCRKCEEEWTKIYGGYNYVCGNGTQAIELALKASFLEKGSNILIPALSPPMVKWAIKNAGYNYIIVDTDKGIFFSSRKVKEMMDKISVVVVINHAGWINPDIEKISKICKKNNVILIEDCSHAQGSKLNDKLAGTFGDIATWSFYATKPITSGEGGMIRFKNKPKKDIHTIINQGRDKEGKYIYDSYNYRLSEFQAVVLYHAIKNLKKYIGKRRKIAKWYYKELEKKDLLWRTFKLKNQKPSFYKFVFMVEREMENKLEEKGIKCAGQCWREEELKDLFVEKYEYTNFFVKNHICLPMHIDIEKKDVKKVVKELKCLIGQAKE